MNKLQIKVETFLWGKPPSDRKERKLLLKLDLVILSYVCLSYFSNYLDRANLANAYTTGMKEDLNFKGNDYTYAGSMFTAGYVIGQWPSALILSSGRISPRFWFPFCMVAWGLCTLGTAWAKTPHQVWGIRFTQALFEASTFSGTHYILGSWYKDHELGKRSAVFATAAQMGTLFSGIMQGGIISNLDGKNGLEGWQFLFIIDFAITIPIAIYGFLMFPGTPHTTKAFWLTEEEREMCLRRLPHTDHVKMTPKTLGKSIKKMLSDWRWYLFTALFTVSATSFEKVGVYTEFNLWLKSAGYSKQQISYYPSIFTAMAILSTYILTLISDQTRNRFIINPIMYLAVFISSVMLLNWNHLNKGAHFFAYIIGGLGYAGQASNFAWANEMCRDDDVLRSITLFSMNLFSNIWNLWYQIVAWPVVEAPRFRNGQIATLVTGAASVAIAVAIVYCSRKYPPALPSAEIVEIDGKLTDVTHNTHTTSNVSNHGEGEGDIESKDVENLHGAISAVKHV
ncbi:MFS transporter, ACS family, pantothenate transporter [Kwoniella mangroviensis CBS 8886]|nr:MFS transporter, ACS family, pantothenate transporter [Kwoniella mangroviensis CBS 8507]OCF67063.1 MFS transporter, ACS family, pantothenate transporter [Kwoniella mangroviensis CBS 8507]OCF77942.1 MFS transporter, ACS family, pantothenate transporter [Kwoniella mangroviensis CBS 8886]